MQRPNTYPRWAITFATVLVVGLIVASAYFFIVLSPSDTSSTASSSSSIASTLSSSSSSSEANTISSQADTAGVVLRTSADCSASVSYDPSAYTYEDTAGYRNFFGADTKGLKLTDGSHELLVECGQITADQDSNSVLESLQQSWFNEGINYNFNTINADYQIDGRSSIELDLSYTDTDGNYHSERIFVVAAPEKVLGYVIRVTDNNTIYPDSFASEILPSLKLVVGV